MELDKRIKEGKRPLTCFDVEQAKEFLGKECYFSNCKSHYKNLSAFEKYVTLTDYCIGTLTAIMDLGDRVFDVDQQCKEFRYCLPCEWVKPEEPEKKYRPFSLNEFLNRYRLGNTVYFRRIGYKEVKCAMFVEYVRGESPEENQIVLGNMRYTLAYLFKNHELSLEDIWQPFGVLDE